MALNIIGALLLLILLVLALVGAAAIVLIVYTIRDDMDYRNNNNINR